MPIATKSQHQRIMTVVVTYVLLWLALWFSARIADVLGGASLWFLPAGLRFCAFVLFGWPALLVELATVFIANMVSFLSAGQELPVLLSTRTAWLVYDWCALPLTYAAVLFPIRRLFKGRLDLALPRHSVFFVSAALVSAGLGAVTGTVYLIGSGIVVPTRWASATVAWFTGDFIGIVTLAPLLLMRGWPSLLRYMEKDHTHPSSPSATPIGGAHADRKVLGVSSSALLLVFGLPDFFHLNIQFPLVALFLLLPLVWVALNYGLRGAVLAVVLLDSGVVVAVAHLQQQALALDYQLVMVAIALVGLWMGGAVTSRHQVVKTFNNELLAQVAHQTKALHDANRELAFKEQHLQLVLAAAPVGVLQFDGAGRCSDLNGVGLSLTESTLEQARGRHLFDFVHPQDLEKMTATWTQQRQSNTVQKLDIRLKGGTWCSAHWVHLTHADSTLDTSILVLADCTEARQREDQLWALGHHDLLTQLPNRKLFMDRSEHALSLAKRHANGAAVVWIDLDEFKSVNDGLGHAAGDALLLQVAQRLKSRIRDSDTLARLGGDEFALIMPEVSSADAVMQFAFELVARINEPFMLPQGTAQISCSIGVALYPDHADTIEALLQRADTAMYRAKEAGKNQVQIAGTHTF